jgi:transcriptional pleiotropic repressor
VFSKEWGSQHMSEVRIFSKNLSSIVQQAEDMSNLLANICKLLSESMQANIIVLDKEGRSIANQCLLDQNVFHQSFFSDSTEKKEKAAQEPTQNFLHDQFNNIIEIVENIPMAEFYAQSLADVDLSRCQTNVYPIQVKSQRVATLLMYRVDRRFIEHELMQAEMCVTMISLLLNYFASQVKAESRRRTSIVKSAINTLSYSEMEAVRRIFEALKGKEGFIVASKIADSAGITRSVIVNAIRKLESAGVIESRSLGMKGTFLRVLNESFLHELQRQNA